MTMVQSVLKPGTVYAAHDRFVCASTGCAGCTAAASGVDIGGARLRELDAQDIAEWASYDLGPLTCECGAVTAGGA